MPVTYADLGTQRYEPAQEVPDTVSGILSPDNQRFPDEAPKSFLGFTPPQGARLTRAHTRMRKGKGRKAAVRGLGADGGNG